MQQSDHLDLADVAAFIAVAETGSFAAASKRLLRDPTAISRRVQALQGQGFADAQLYGYPGGQGATGGVGGLRSFFLLMDEPNVYNLPAAPRLPSRNIGPGLLASAATAALLIGAAAFSFLGGRRKDGGEGEE